jgi:hypothetical protein
MDQGTFHILSNYSLTVVFDDTYANQKARLTKQLMGSPKVGIGTCTSLSVISIVVGTVSLK